jgi:hypothetical protein
MCSSVGRTDAWISDAVIARPRVESSTSDTSALAVIAAAALIRVAISNARRWSCSERSSSLAPPIAPRSESGSPNLT